MHEMALCESIMNIVTQQARENGASRVLKVRIEIGDYSGASEESLRFCFPIVARGTMAEEAKIEFLRAPDRTLRVVDLDIE